MEGDFFISVFVLMSCRAYIILRTALLLFLRIYSGICMVGFLVNFSSKRRT